MVETIDPAWTIRDHRPAEAGYLPVYHLEIDSPDGPRRVVLKASTAEDVQGVDLEARLLGTLAEQTSIPVPGVHGVVEEDEDLPTPYFCMAHVPGLTVERQDVDGLPPSTVEAVARDSGRYLAHLHSLAAVEAFGFLAADPSTTLRGERPPSTLDQFAVVDPVSAWRSLLRDWADEALTGVAETSFADLVPELRAVLEREIEALQGPFDPVLARVDNSIENLRFDPETGEVTGMLDWAFTIAATPAYDLVHVEQSLYGGLWRFLPSTSVNSTTIRAALLDGYGAVGSTPVRETLEANRECYELLSACRATFLLEDWPGLSGGAPGQEAAAADAIRARLEEYL